MLLEDTYNVYTAVDSKEAIGVVGRYQIDIALVDLRLGSGLSGIRVAKKLLAIRPDLRIIFMSAIIAREETIGSYRSIEKDPQRILKELTAMEEDITEQFDGNKENG